MRAVRLSAHGGPEVLVLTEVATPEPGPGQVRVAVDAAGVNFADIYNRTGLYPLDLPSGIGQEGAGRVSAVGPDVTSLAVGDRVAWVGVVGSYADEVLVPAERAVGLPEGVTTDQAATVMLQGMTAHFLTHDTKALGPDDTVLVWAPAGGVGRLLVQMAVGRGARTIAVTSSEAKADEARRLGAADVIVAPPAEVAARVRALTDDRGVDVVYDSVGTASIEASLDSAARRGLVVSYGQASGPVGPLDPLALNRRGSLFLTRPSLFDHIRGRDELVARAGAVLAMVDAGALELRVHARYPLGDAARAHVDLASGTTSGKLLIVPTLDAGA